MRPESVEVFGHSYQIGRMNAIDQFHVMRRLHALAASAGETLGAVQRMGGASEFARAVAEKRPTDNVLAVIEPILRALGTMKDDDANYVIHHCLGVVERAIPNGKGWAPVMPQPGVLMFQDVSMPCVLVLSWHALRVNLSDFFSDLLSALTAQGTGSPVSSS